MFAAPSPFARSGALVAALLLLAGASGAAASAPERSRAERDELARPRLAPTSEAQGTIEGRSRTVRRSLGTALPAPPPESLVFGGDDRVRVLDTDRYPWNTLCYVESTFSDGSVFGFTGVLVSPYTVLTSALAVYQHERGWVESALVVPGQTQEAEGEPILEPWGSEFAEFVEVPQAWIDDADAASLYGALFLPRAFAGIDRFVPLSFGARPGGTVELSGYDQFARGEDNSFALWRRQGTVRAWDAEFFEHRLDDDAGALGAPAWDLTGGGQPGAIFGLNCCVTSDDSANAGVRFTSSNEALLRDWLAWEPEGNGGGGDDPWLDDASTDPCFPDDTTLCLVDGRFEVTASYVLGDDRRGSMGVGEVTDDTGALYFLNPSNVEVFVKVLDGCGINERWWIFAAGLTDQGVELVVRDSVAGKSRTYANPLGSVFETVVGTVDPAGAFATCP